MQLLTTIFDVRSWRVLRRKVIALVGTVGVLALTGSSSALDPVAIALLKARAAGSAAEPQEGQSYYYDGLWSGTPDPSQIVPSGGRNAQPAAAKPYGLRSTAALTASGIPLPAYRAYVAAATELARTDPSCGVSWTVIAGIGRVESNHGRYGGSTINADGLITPPILGIRLDGTRSGTARITDSDNGRYDGDTAFDRAVGPMQFLPGTWKSYGGGANPQNMNAAALATGRYLCAGNSSLATQPGRWAAVYRYNHSDSYVSLVLSLADSYASGEAVQFPARPAGTPKPDDDAPAATPPGPPPSLPANPATEPTTSPTAPPTTAPSTTPPTVGPTTAPPATPTASPTDGGSVPTSAPATTPAADPTTPPIADPTTTSPPEPDPTTTSPPEPDPTTTSPPEPASTTASAGDPDPTTTGVSGG